MKLLTPIEAQALLESDERAIYLDVRSETEFAAGHPEGAYNVPLIASTPAGPMPNPDFVATVERAFSKDTPIACGCQVGGRSARAVQMLTAAGFTNVANVIGGFAGGPDPRNGSPVAGWHAAGLPVSDQDDGRDHASVRNKEA
ncbi:MAG: rhodanese-like domain-containing protein [Deltaproteobacteria bacterium]|nr:rhodanese-like domain-containing protein [Deltaproteobacteria bacterium]